MLTRKSHTRRSLKTKPCAMLAPLVVTAVTGCSAMVRTWHFGAEPVQGPRLQVAVTEAKVRQRDAHLTLRLHNRSSAPQRIQVKALVMTLSDGQRVTGKTSLVGRMSTTVQNRLSSWGIGKRAPEPALAPGASMEVRLGFRQHRRDLRRHPRLTIDLSGIHVDGQPVRLPPLVLKQPDGAPVGEHI